MFAFIVSIVDYFADRKIFKILVNAVRGTIEEAPPELVADIMEKGIILSGGSAQLHNLPEFFERYLGVPAYLAEDPLFCVARGTGLILNHLDSYKKTLLNKR